MTTEDLFEAGFREIGEWTLDAGKLSLRKIDETNPAWKVQNTLYAFAVRWPGSSDAGSVKYIGKTTQSLVKRFAGYLSPGNTTATNQRCHQAILRELNAQKMVSILSFSGPHLLQWGRYEINMAAGLEDDLIRKFQPEWNGSNHAGKSRLTEQGELESETQSAARTSESPGESPLAGNEFEIRLGETYYSTGYINPGVKVSREFGKHGDTILIYLGNDKACVESSIDRNANGTGAPRILARAAVRDFFQNNFKLNQTVRAKIIPPHAIKLLLPEQE